MKKNILLPTDFSENAWSAALYAFGLYAEESCTFHFLHSSKLNASRMQSISNKLVRAMADNAMEELLELQKKAEEANPNPKHNFEVIVSTHDLLHTIQTTITNHNIDCVVMGTKGATKAKEIIFGSNTVTIIQKLKNSPVLAVPDAFDFKKPEQIAFPTDFSRFYGDELSAVKKLAKLHNSKIRIVHVNTEDNLTKAQNYNLAMLKAYLEDYPHSFHWTPNTSKKENAIKDFIEELDINILVMINYKQSFIESIIKEPVIKKLGFQPTIPFLVIPCLD